MDLDCIPADLVSEQLHMADVDDRFTGACNGGKNLAAAKVTNGKDNFGGKGEQAILLNPRMSHKDHQPLKERPARVCGPFPPLGMIHLRQETALNGSPFFVAAVAPGAVFSGFLFGKRLFGLVFIFAQRLDHIFCPHASLFQCGINNIGGVFLVCTGLRL